MVSTVDTWTQLRGHHHNHLPELDPRVRARSGDRMVDLTRYHMAELDDQLLFDLRLLGCTLVRVYGPWEPEVPEPAMVGEARLDIDAHQRVVTIRMRLR